MSLILENPEVEVEKIVDFLRETANKTQVSTLVVAVSGGIDSALSLSLAVKAVGAENVHALMLPYHDQSVTDSQEIIRWNELPSQNTHTINIGEIVDTLVSSLAVGDDNLRKGNIMARTRMIAVYDLAKELNGLVCGTENKSEKYLGYFTRFGDEASDIEPLQHLYKSQVRQLAEFLDLPNVFLQKAPSAGLWQGQTDEEELGFSYQEADLALEQIVDGKQNDVEKIILEKVKARVASQQFKHEVPYTL